MTPPGMIVIAGAGPGDPNVRTAEFAAEVNRAEKMILRTAIHPGVADLLLSPKLQTCDDLYESCATFAEVYSGIADRVIAAARHGDVLYIVPGHPSFGENSVTQIVERADREGLTVRLTTSVSAIDAIATALRIDLFDLNVQVLDGLWLESLISREPFSGSAVELSTSRPMLISQVYRQSTASAVKFALTRILPADHRIAVVTAAGIADQESITWCQLGEVDRIPMNHLTTLWIPALDEISAHRVPSALALIVARLRQEDGCPWDRQQTHISLRNAVLDESYEVVDAIDSGDIDNLCEELGDLLLLVMMHAQIAEENAEFILEDVCASIISKLIRRHPHVFGDDIALSADAVVHTWQRMKTEERRNSGKQDPFDPFDTLPRSMPSLVKAHKLFAQFPSTEIDNRTPSAFIEKMMESVEGLVRCGYDPEDEFNSALQEKFCSLARLTTDPDDS